MGRLGIPATPRRPWDAEPSRNAPRIKHSTLLSSPCRANVSPTSSRSPLVVLPTSTRRHLVVLLPTSPSTSPRRLRFAKPRRNAPRIKHFTLLLSLAAPTSRRRRAGNLSSSSRLPPDLPSASPRRRADDEERLGAHNAHVSKEFGGFCSTSAPPWDPGSRETCQRNSKGRQGIPQRATCTRVQRIWSILLLQGATLDLSARR